MNTVNRPLGLLGGTFDPVHNAHLRLAIEAIEALSLSGLRWIPSGRPGHRGTPGANTDDRLAMLRIATSGDARFTIDEADARATEPTYTINTLARLRRELGAMLPLVLVVGADHLLGLHTWREWQRLFEHAHIAVAQRPGHDIARDALHPEVGAEYDRRLASPAALAAAPAGALTVFRMTPLDISASAIRDALASGRSARYLLPDPVLDYIEKKRLYS